MGDATDPQEQLAVRESGITNARIELRAERELVHADRAKADQLLAETQAAHQDANRARSRARRLAGRFASQLEERTAAARKKLDDRATELAADRDRFAADVDQLNAVRSEFHEAAAAARDRIAAAWATVEAQQKRAAGEWTEANRYFLEQNAVIDARMAEVEQREKAAADRLARVEAETAGLQEEATALEERVQNARVALSELERRRDRIRAELLNSDLPTNLLQNASSDDVPLREMLNRERAAVVALRAHLEQESADVDDRRRLVVEQLGQLAEARLRWHKAERQTVQEMEELARSLRHKEQELEAREQRLIRADTRRRSESYDLWQQRLRLEAWQAKLTAFELRWHTEREQLEAHLERRIATCARREAAHAATFARWEQARSADHTRLREELKYWVADRERLTQATAQFDCLRQEVLGELTRHASEALAAEQLLAEAIQDSGSNRVVRRLRVLRKRWERVFARHARALIAHRAEVARERAVLDDRYRELHERVTKVGEREAAANSSQTMAERTAILEAIGSVANPGPHPIVSAPSAELTALRAEVERLATIVLEVDLPESEIPWAVEEADPAPEVLPFGTETSSRAA